MSSWFLIICVFRSEMKLSGVDCILNVSVECSDIQFDSPSTLFISKLQTISKKSSPCGFRLLPPSITGKIAFFIHDVYEGNYRQFSIDFNRIYLCCPGFPSAFLSRVDGIWRHSYAWRHRQDFHTISLRGMKNILAIFRASLFNLLWVSPSPLFHKSGSTLINCLNLLPAS
jgi:hypothetical protein